MLMAPTHVSGRPSQRRAVGAWPTPTAATLPRCSQMPSPLSLRYIASGAVGVVITRTPCPTGRQVDRDQSAITRHSGTS